MCKLFPAARIQAKGRSTGLLRTTASRITLRSIQAAADTGAAHV